MRGAGHPPGRDPHGGLRQRQPDPAGRGRAPLRLVRDPGGAVRPGPGPVLPADPLPQGPHRRVLQALRAGGGVLPPGVPAPGPGGRDRPPPAAGVRPVRLLVPAHPVGGLPGEHRLRQDVPHLAGKAGRGQDLHPGEGGPVLLRGGGLPGAVAPGGGLPLRRGDSPGQRGAERAVRLPLPAGVRQALFTAEGGIPLPVPAVLPELRPGQQGPCPSAAGRTWTCWRKPSRGWRPCGRSWELCPPPTTSGRS